MFTLLLRRPSSSSSAGQPHRALAPASVLLRFGGDWQDAIAVMPSDHPMALLEVVSLADFEGERFISMRSGSIFSSDVELALAQVPRVARLEASLAHTACGGGGEHR